MSSTQPNPQCQDQNNKPDPLPPHLNPSTYPRTLTTTQNEVPIHCSLTYASLDPNSALEMISSASAGANILFLGTTRNTFEDRAVSQLSYTTYPQLALKTMEKIARDAVGTYELLGVYISHRLGIVAVKEASIVVAVSAGHRGEAWRGAEGILEVVKEKLEVWKREEFVDGGMEWRENREGDARGNLIDRVEGEKSE